MRPILIVVPKIGTASGFAVSIFLFPRGIIPRTSARLFGETTMNGNIKETLSDKKVFVLPYCHSDWAWTHTRSWHAFRYIKILDEVIKLAEKNGEFRFFFDSVLEFLPPFLKYRPEKIGALQKLIANRQISIVGGQLCNQRPATAGEESFIRNITLGRKRCKQLFPDAKFLGFANLDTAIGHSQLPQILASAEFRYYLAWRPEWALDSHNIPRIFQWQGLDGQQIAVMRQCYAGLFAEELLPDPIDQNIEKISEKFIPVIKPYFQQGLDIAYIYAGMDDTRPLRDHKTDKELPVSDFIEYCNTKLSTSMRFATPDELFDEIEISKLPQIEGTIDQADVCYNGPFGTNNLATLRIKAEQHILTAEMVNAIFPQKNSLEIEDRIEKLWEKFMVGTAHATQFLFADDSMELRLSLENVITESKKITGKIIDENLKILPPQDTDTITIINPLPYQRDEIVSIPITNIDLTIPNYQLIDNNNRPIPLQPADRKYAHQASEWNILARVSLPAAGYKQLRLLPDDAPLPEIQSENLPLDCKIEAASLKLEFQAGKLVEITGKNNRISSANGILEICRFDSRSTPDPILNKAGETESWMTGAIAEGSTTDDFQVKSISLLEAGPLRWRIQRKFESPKHNAVQYLDIDDRGIINCRTQIHIAPENAMLGISFPNDRADSLLCGIPFGEEGRNIETIKYQNGVEGVSIERLIHGMFWAYDWLVVNDNKYNYGVITPYGDKYWYRPPDGHDTLVHLLSRVYSGFYNPDKWEFYSAIDTIIPGKNEFCHLLIVDKEQLNSASLTRIKQKYLIAPQTFDTEQHESEKTMIKLTPDNIRITELRTVNGEMEIRLSESAGEATRVKLEFASSIRFARKLNLAGRYLGNIAPEENQISIKMRPWEIQTIRVAFVPENVLPDAPAGNLKIDRLKEDDLPALLKFYNSLDFNAVEKYRPYGWVTSEPALQTGPIERTMQNKEISLVIRDESGCIWGHSFIITRKIPSFGIGLHAKLRGKGLGKKIITETFRLADEEYKLKEVELTVLKENIRAAGLYQSIGFEIVDEFTPDDDHTEYLKMIRRR